jgi:DNA-binding beta-propeller fold protein YncE
MTFAPDKAPRAPVALVPVADELYVLDSRGVTVFGLDGNPRRQLGQVQKPTDCAVAADGTVFIADQGAGGVLVYEGDGRFRARLGLPGTGEDAFAELTRLALGPDGVLYALDARQRRVQRFDRHHRRLPTWTVQTDDRNPPVGCAVHAKGLLVALAGGTIQVFDRKGLASEAWKPLAEANLVDRCDQAGTLTVDRSGEVLLAYPGRGLVARYGADGQVAGVRGAALWEVKHLAADGRGRLFGLDGESRVCEFDAEGWLVARFGGPLGSGGFFDDPTGLAPCPDGSALAVMDAGRQMVVRFALDGDRAKPVVFGQPGRNPGQFQKPVSIAMDAAGRTYVLDAKQCRVQVFDAKGANLFTFGRAGSGADELGDPLALTVSPAGDAVYVYDDDRYEIKKFALDFTKGQATHVNNTGGKGDAPGQFRAVGALGCDRRGLLYAWDGGRKDLQILDFRGSNAVAGVPRKAVDLGLERVDHLILSPDGLVHLVGGGMVVGWGW